MKTKITNLSSLLLNWYDENRRVLPWREDPTPYHVWLSEIMLQQTRVEAVKRYYDRFLHYLPTVNALAEAEDDMVMKLWEGLGYYSRARNLKKAAKVITEEYDGSFPNSKKELMGLPGIGDYTSSAIAAIAFQKKEIAIDGNLIRVYARLKKEESDSKSTEMKEKAYAFWKRQLEERPADFNQALMDLGELVCLPNGSPKCAECPFKEICLAHKDAVEVAYPKKEKKKEKRVCHKTVFVIRYQGDILLNKRPEEGLLASLYELPNIDGHLNKEECVHYLEKQGYVVTSLKNETRAKHVFTHLIWEMVCYEIEAPKIPELPSTYVIAPKQDVFGKYSIPSAFKGFFALL